MTTRPRRTRLCFTLAAAALAGGLLTAQSRPSLEQLIESYAAGEYEVVRRTIRSEADFHAIMPTFRFTTTTWRSEWTMLRAAFILEVVVASLEGAWRGHARRQVLDQVVRLIEARPQRPGASAEQDAFEISFHLALLGFLQKAVQVEAVEEYLEHIGWRIGPEGRDNGRGRLIEPRFVLIAAIAQEQRASPEALARLRRSPEAPLRIEPNRSIAAIVTEALRRLDTAAAHAPVRAEALVRRALLLHRLGRDNEALAALDAAPPTDDEVVRYWGLLFRGRILEARGEPAGAVRAYEQAAALWPGAQSPAAALASLHVRQGRHAEALRWSRAALEAPDEALDPWWFYWFGDGRWAEAYLARVRAVAR